MAAEQLVPQNYAGLPSSNLYGDCVGMILVNLKPEASNSLGYSISVVVHAHYQVAFRKSFLAPRLHVELADKPTIPLPSVHHE